LLKLRREVSTFILNTDTNKCKGQRYQDTDESDDEQIKQTTSNDRRNRNNQKGKSPELNLDGNQDSNSEDDEEDEENEIEGDEEETVITKHRKCEYLNNITIY